MQLQKTLENEHRQSANSVNIFINLTTHALQKLKRIKTQRKCFHAALKCDEPAWDLLFNTQLWPLKLKALNHTSQRNHHFFFFFFFCLNSDSERERGWYVAKSHRLDTNPCRCSEDYNSMVHAWYIHTKEKIGLCPDGVTPISVNSVDHLRAQKSTITQWEKIQIKSHQVLCGTYIPHAAEV